MFVAAAAKETGEGLLERAVVGAVFRAPVCRVNGSSRRDSIVCILPVSIGLARSVTQ
jgi:hypothetical protein